MKSIGGPPLVLARFHQSPDAGLALAVPDAGLARAVPTAELVAMPAAAAGLLSLGD
jgi:hypothetical protein